MLAQVQQALQPIFEAHPPGHLHQWRSGDRQEPLSLEVQQRLQAQANVTWLVGQADQLNRTPLSAFAYFLRLYFGQRRERDTAANRTAFDAAFDGLLALADEAHRADLLLYGSFLAEVVGLVIPGSPYETADEKLRFDNAIAAIKVWARAESRRQPLIIQLEDAHWLDAISIRALQQLTYIWRMCRWRFC